MSKQPLKKQNVPITKSKPIVLELTEIQASTISLACELLFRIQMGQLRNIVSLALNFLPKNEVSEIKARFYALEHLVKNPLGDNGSVEVHVPETSRISWDIHQVIRHHLAWMHKPEGGITVNFDIPNTLSHTEPLPIIIDKRNSLK